MNKELDLAKEKIKNAEKIVVLTGAGISTASGIPDFRGEEGLYSEYPEDILSKHAFWGRTEEFYKAFQDKFSKVYNAKPNRAHEILAEWENKGKIIGIVTQNIDGLHQMAGSKNVVEYHGTIWKFARYDKEGIVDSYDVDYKDIVREDGVIDYYTGSLLHKPNVVLFGESVLRHNDAANLVAEADLILVLGTHLVVFPFNSLPSYNYYYGTKTSIIVINKTDKEGHIEGLIQIKDDITYTLEEINKVI